VAERFGAAAQTYDAHSHIQRQAAETLAGHIATCTLPPQMRVLEVGCGTGHLSALLARQWPEAWILATDIALPMAAACRARLPNLCHAVMDASRPTVTGPFDLVCSNFAAQWFPDLPATLAGLACCLVPGGVLAMSLLGEQTFKEWRAAHRSAGLPDKVLPFPSLTACRDAFPAAGKLLVETEILVARPASALIFLRHLRAIGADTPASGHVPLSPGQIRHLLRALGEHPEITYEVHHVRWTAS
jgi:malonyl-CoA O-methyltransferase